MLGGLELADSLSLDPHKWLFQPFECGCVLLRDQRRLRDTFEILPEYLKDTQGLGRVERHRLRHSTHTQFPALKLWLSIKTFGMAAFRAAVERGFALAELTERELRGRPEWEVVSPAQRAIVCFRFRRGDAAFHLALVQEILRDGYCLITSTTLRGQTMLRMCPINPRTTDEEIRETLKRVDGLARELSGRVVNYVP